jgi:hypothetical protein
MAYLQAREATAHHHHVGPAAHRRIGRIQLQKKAFHGLATAILLKLWHIWAAPGNHSHHSCIRLPAEFDGAVSSVNSSVNLSTKSSVNLSTI